MLLYVPQTMSERHQSSPMPPSRHNPHHLLSPIISPSLNPEVSDGSSQNSPISPGSESSEAGRAPSPAKELPDGTEEQQISQASDNSEDKKSHECQNQQKRSKLEFEQFEQQFQDEQLNEFVAGAGPTSSSSWTFNAANELVDPTSGKSYEIASEFLEQQHSHHSHASAAPDYSPLTTTIANEAISMTAQDPLLTSSLVPVFNLQQQHSLFASSRPPLSPTLPTPPPPVDITGELSSTDPYQPVPQSEASTTQSSPSSMHDYLRRGSLDWESMTQVEQDYINAHANATGNRMEVSASNRKQSLYKTELCRSWEETTTCRYGRKCQYAHGEEELRPVIRHPKYKTVICKTFWETGSCPYGVRCCFIHRGETRANKKVILVDTKVPRGRRISSDSVESGDGDGDSSGGEPAPSIPSVPTTAVLEKEQGWVMYTGAGPSREHSPGAVLPPPTTGPLRFSRGIHPRSYQQQSPQLQQHQQLQQQDHPHYSAGANVSTVSQIRSNTSGRDLTIDTSVQDRLSSLSLRDVASTTGGSPLEGHPYRHGSNTAPSVAGSQEGIYQMFSNKSLQNSTGSSPAASYPSTPTLASSSYIDHRNSPDYRAFADFYFGHGPISAGLTAQRRASYQYSLAHQSYPQDPLLAVPEPTNTSMTNRQQHELYLPSNLFTELSSPNGTALTSASTSPIISSRRPRAQSEILYGPVAPHTYFPSSTHDRSGSQTSTTGLTTILTSTYDDVRERMGTSMLGAGAVGSERGRRTKNISDYKNSGFGGDSDQGTDEIADSNSGFSYIY